METKFIEVRDEGICIAVMCTALQVDRNNDPVGFAFVHGRGGHPTLYSNILMTRLDDGTSNFDPYNWGNGGRTLGLVHVWIADNWDDVVSGQVVDWRVCSGEMHPADVPAPEIYREGVK